MINLHKKISDIGEKISNDHAVHAKNMGKIIDASSGNLEKKLSSTFGKKEFKFSLAPFQDNEDTQKKQKDEENKNAALIKHAQGLLL